MSTAEASDLKRTGVSPLAEEILDDILGPVPANGTCGACTHWAQHDDLPAGICERVGIVTLDVRRATPSPLAEIRSDDEDSYLWTDAAFGCSLHADRPETAGRTAPGTGDASSGVGGASPEFAGSVGHAPEIENDINQVLRFINTVYPDAGQRAAARMDAYAAMKRVRDHYRRESSNG